MTCEDLKFELSFYLEDELTAEVRLTVEDHLSACPLCRAELAQYRELSQEFKSIGKPQLSNSAVSSIQHALRVELALADTGPKISFGEKFQNWLRPKLIPYGVGTFASVTIFALLAMGIMLPANGIPSNDPNSYAAGHSRLLGLDMNDEGTMVAFKYGNERSEFAQDSPSLNPNGALLAATSAMTRRGGKNSEIVLVADVFSNGIARISEVVQSTPDAKTMRELESAMNEEVTASAFVPAQLDKRSDAVQIVLKIHEVNVTFPEKRAAKRPRRLSRAD